MDPNTSRQSIALNPKPNSQQQSQPETYNNVNQRRLKERVHNSSRQNRRQ